MGDTIPPHPIELPTGFLFDKKIKNISRMHPFFSQSGFKPPVLVPEDEGLQIEADDSGMDVYRNILASGVLIQNTAYMVETNTRFDRPLRCELFDPNADSRSLSMNIMDVRFRCMRCGELASRVVVPDQFPKLSISNQRCSTKESCRLRCLCDGADDLELEVTLAPLQTRDTYFCQQYDITLPPNSDHRMEHLFQVPVESVRQNMNSVELGEFADVRRFQYTMLFDDVGLGQLYEFPLAVMSLGVDIREGALRNSFQMKNEEAHSQALRIRICSAHLFGTNFVDSVRYFRTLYTSTFTEETTDLMAEHVAEWSLVRSQIESVFKANLTDDQQQDADAFLRKMSVSMFESLMSRHEIDEDDTASLPILTLLRPNVAKTILETRIKYLDRDLPRRIGYDGAAVRWREDSFAYWRTESAQRIYRNGLLIIQIWNYFRHTADYTWLESVGYPAIYNSATFISEFRYTDPASSAIRFRNVKNVQGVSVENDLFTNRICALALTYASTAAWKLNFKHQLIWEEYHLRESRQVIDIGTTTVPSETFDASDKRLLMDVEKIKGMPTYVVHWLEEIEGEIVSHRIGHRFGEECGRYILVNANTTMVQTQLVRTSYPLQVLDRSDAILSPTGANTEWSLANAKTYMYKFRDTKQFFTITRLEFCQYFGTNVFHTTAPSEGIEKIDPSALDSFVCISMGGPYSDYITPKDLLTHAVNDHPSSVDPNDRICMSADLGNMQAFQNIKEKWSYMKYAFDSILKGTHSSSKTIFGFLFGIMQIRFQGNTSSKAATVEEYASICTNDGIFPSTIDRVILHNVSYLDTSIRNGLFRIESRASDPLPHLLRYYPERDEPLFQIELNKEAMGIADEIDPMISNQTDHTVNRSIVVEGTNYQTDVSLVNTNVYELQILFKSQTVTKSISLYDHDSSRDDPLPNARGALVYLFDPTEGNGVRADLSLDTLDQTTYLAVKQIRLGFAFQPVFLKAKIVLFDGTTSTRDVEGLSALQVDETLSTPVSGRNVPVMQITMFLAPEKEYLLELTPPFYYVNVELLDASGDSVIRYHQSKRMLLEQRSPVFISYAPPTLPGHIDTRVFFDPSAVPSEPSSFVTQSWYAIDLDSGAKTSLSEPSSTTTLLTNYGRQASENYYMDEFDASSQHVELVVERAVQFASDFGSSFQSVDAAIARHISSHSQFPVIWIRAFKTHIILCHSNYAVYGIGTHVNFYRMTQSRRIVLDDVEELESLRAHVSEPDRAVTDAQEGANGDSLRFAIRSGERTFWWGIGTNYYNTLGVSAYDPLRHDLVEDTVSLRNVQEELVYLDMMNERIDTGYHRAEAVLPLRQNRSDEVMIYDKIERVAQILGGRFSPRDWTSVSLQEHLTEEVLHTIRYDNIEKRLLIGTTSP